MAPKKTVEETYKKLSQREHVLHRPGMYIGEVKKTVEEQWIYNVSKKRMVKQMVEYSPGFLKVFDEALTNATDHAARDPTVTTIKVDFDKETGIITIWNNGTGVPVVEHKEHNMYVPELIFGHLLSGSNYDDKQSRTGAGTNGVGIKTTNIYSKEFTIETVDAERGLKFVQVYTDNMQNKSKPKITKCSNKAYTQITYTPDYARFGMKGLTKDTMALLSKRVVDCIAVTHARVSVYLHGEKLVGKGLQDYTKYFFTDSQNETKVYYENASQRVNGIDFAWEYAIVPSDTFEQVSFVNGNATHQGGKHVDNIMYQITDKLKTLLLSKKKLKDVKPGMIRDRMFLFLRATVVNPQFNSQTKEYLTTATKDFGCKVEVTDKFIDKIWKSPIIEEIVTLCKAKESIDLARATDGKKKNRIFIPKLEDALWAGTAKSEQCTLILTEGDSAKTFAMWGRSIVGAERYGIYPLKGKCICADTQIPLWNGDIKLAKDIQIGDVLIGEDGTPRNVLTLFQDKGNMFEITQDRGEKYKVNEDHILTVCMPEHKVMFWSWSTYSWQALYWDDEYKCVRTKLIRVPIEVECRECRTKMKNANLLKHYRKYHADVKYKQYNLDIGQSETQLILETKELLQNFLDGIPDYDIIDINIQDYLCSSKLTKRKLKGVRGACVDWEYKPVHLDPYLLGLWLGDGSKAGYGYACNAKDDIEIVEYLSRWGKHNDAIFKKVQSSAYGYSISSRDNRRRKGYAPLKKQLDNYGLVNQKHIPKDFLVNSRDIRLQVLAGLIDTDGYVGKDGRIEISQGKCHEKLVNDIVFLCRSLGFFTRLTERTVYYSYKGHRKSSQAYRIMISGETDSIPTKLQRKKTRNLSRYKTFKSTGRLSVKPIEEDMYVGIGVDRTNRFVVNDFTVTHNCLNVRDASVQQLMNNEELNNLKQIIGLQQGKEYTSTKDLRYGKVMALTDSDLDGSHIKALLVNFFHAQWPELLKLGFIQTLRTPIIKAIKGRQVVEFYTEQDYKIWQGATANAGSYHIRYFKGLGTSKKEDAKETFQRIGNLTVDYYYKDRKCDEAILLAFEKDKNVGKDTGKMTATDTVTDTVRVKCTDKRKEWLSGYDKDNYITAEEQRVSFQDLIHKELIHFSIYDNTRSIPSICDGLKPSQRKILYYMLKKNITKSIKVAQLSGYVSAETGYHHGEASLQQAIIGMAQNFVGSNNINLLFPDGNFGSRLAGGKDAASPRYIYTYTEPIARRIFDVQDTPLLTMQEDDGMEVEPTWFVPVLPMVLVNGCEGIGTGFSTYIPPHNPKDIIANLYRVMDGKEPLPMKPYFKGFQGDVIALGDNAFATKGAWKRTGQTTLEITELPVGVWVTQYKEFLETLVENTSSKSKSDSGAKKRAHGIVLKDVQNHTADENTGIRFVLEFKDTSTLDTVIQKATLEKELKLIKQFNTNNMYLFDEALTPGRYSTTTDILLDYYDIRVELYQTRKDYLLTKLDRESSILNAKMRFIQEYISGVLQINNKTKDYIFTTLAERKYPKHSVDSEATPSYEYLVRMPLVSLTKDKIDELQKQIDEKQRLLIALRAKTPVQLWRDDLAEVEKLL